ncbi:response regulator [Maridesulfovibrio sp. FT414]|uniref:response regulator n=1 Tax=Maridesulfovibrio sp. FT414 TaxID=2979469 RepID=UPI003D808A0A
MFKFLRIKYRIALGLLLILAGILVPLGFLVTDYRHDELYDSLKSQADSIASLVATSSSEAIVRFQNNRMDDLVRSACSSNDVVFCAVYAPGGDAYSEFSRPMPKDYNGQVVYVERRILRDGDYLGYVKVGVLKSREYESWDFVLGYLLPVFMGVAVLAAFCAIFFLGRSLVSPVIRLSRQAQGMVRGDFDEFDVDGREDEVGELAASLNLLARKFSRMQSDLEEKVQRRTEDLTIANQRLCDEVEERRKAEQRLNSTLEQLSFTVKELEKARDKAEKASRFKSEFLAMISHEIRTPMNAILGMGELLMETELDVEQQGYVEIFRGSGELLLKIINDILDFVQIESGQIELVPVPFDPSHAMQSVCKSMAHSAHARDIEIICDVDPGVPAQVVGDPVRVRQILMNIVANAVKFTSSGEVDVRASLKESGDEFDRLLFTVRDTGIGIPEGKRGNIFESFVQADGSTTREFGGVGLGLASASRLADLMDGEIWFESKRGKGTVFYFSIPFKKSVYEPDRSVADFSGIRVLLVDDNRTVREVLGRRLQTFGIDSSTASDGNEGIEYLRSAAELGEAYDLIIADSEMPDMQGVDFLSKAKQENLLSGMVAMMFSAGCTEAQRRNARMLGADYTLIKPVFDADLVRCLKATAGQEKPSVAKPGKGMQILLVEDNEDHRRILELFIADTGAEVTMAEDGLRAVQLFSDGEFDLVFMDLELPVMGGIEAVGRIRDFEKVGSREPATIIALAAHAFNDHRMECRRAGCNGFISKPVRWDTIRATIAAAAGGSTLPANILLTE